MTTPSSLTPVTSGGVTKLIVGTVPAVNTEYIEVVPAEALWHPLTLAFTYTCSAAAPGRSVAIAFDNGGLPAFAGAAYDALIGANAVVRFYFSLGFAKPWNDQGGVGYGPIPEDITLYAGYRIRTAVVGMQAGDQISQILLTVR